MNNNALLHSTGAGILLALVSVLTVNVLLGMEASTLEILAVSTSFVCTMWFVWQLRVAYIMMGITTFLYSLVFFEVDLLASAALNFVFLMPFAIYGWYVWGKDGELPVRSLIADWKQDGIPLWLWITPLIWISLVAFFTAMGGQFTGPDSLILLLTVVAQMLMTHKRLESWHVWAIMNVIAIGTYLSAGLYLVTFQYLFFLGNTIFGWYMWRKSQNVQ
ncbi:MAG: nicotinamide riboside transporter PnuC [Anaerolineaceae bacterium]